MARHGLFESIALAVHLKDVDMVSETVEKSAGQTFGAEHCGPFVEEQVRGHEGGAPLIALAETLEQQLGAGGGKRHVAELVDDQQLVRLDLLLELEKTPLVVGFDQLMDQAGGRGEPDREAALAGGQAERQADVGLAGARRTRDRLPGIRSLWQLSTTRSIRG